MTTEGAGIRDEILRLRDRAHKLASELQAARFEVKALKEWRDEVDKWREDVEEQIDKMLKSDEIADAVAERLDKQQNLHFTILQKAGALAVAMVVVAGGIKGLFFG